LINERRFAIQVELVCLLSGTYSQLSQKRRQKQRSLDSFLVKVARKGSSEQQVTVIPLLQNNKPFSSSNLDRLPHCTGTAMYIYYVQGLEYFVLIILYE
jgi:hypothetical protein